MWAVDRNHVTTAEALIAAKADVNILPKVRPKCRENLCGTFSNEPPVYRTAALH
jgi:hypothetical protein